MSREEFTKGARYALRATLEGYDKEAPDSKVLAFMPLIERGAGDERNFVRKDVSWALRRIGGRIRVLNTASTRVAQKLAASDVGSSRWVGKDALRELTRAKARLARNR